MRVKVLSMEEDNELDLLGWCTSIRDVTKLVSQYLFSIKKISYVCMSEKSHKWLVQKTFFNFFFSITYPLTQRYR